MSKYVFILGAGASKHAGAPLMLDFLDQARDLWSTNRRSERESDLKCVFEAVSKLQRVHSKADLDFINLESVFGAFEMATLLGVSPADVGEDLLGSMRRVIAWTLDHKMKFAVQGGALCSSEPYMDFAALLKDKLGDCSVITFNYDLGLDVALNAVGVTPDYGLAEHHSGGMPFYKLHGSVHWHRCANESCNRIVPETIPLPDRSAPSTAMMPWSLLRRQLRSSASHCGLDAKADCVIVPPSWNKGEHHTGLRDVWRKAAAELKDATHISVCGYSLPPSDSFFRFLYGLGTVGEEVLRSFLVLDPNEQIHERFKSLLGPGARDRFRSEPKPFQQATALLRKWM